ncbi:MAG: O-antigen ligase family protein [Alicyclobacillus sp.]|nr:O-antigen ligase family protein [Alicyclobacillus sp.]
MRRLTFALLCIFIGTIPWENTIVIGSLGTISRLAGGITFVVGILSILKDGKMRRPSTAHAFMIAFISWGGLTFFWSVSPQATLSTTFTYAQLFLLAWMIWEFARERREQLRLMQAYVFGACVSISTIFVNYAHGEQHFYGRYSASGFDPNVVGLVLTLGIPMAWHLCSEPTVRPVLWINRMYIPFATAAILLTASRGAFIALVVAGACITLAYLRNRGGSKILGVLVMTCSLIVAVYWVPQTTWSRLETIAYSVTQGSLDDRTRIWKEGYMQFRERPIVGLGVGAAEYAIEPFFGRPRVIHNVYLSILYEGGIVGEALFLALMYLLVRPLVEYRSPDRLLYITMTVLWAIGGLSLTMEPRKITWLVWGLLSAYTRARKLAEVGIDGKLAAQSPKAAGVSFTSQGKPPAWPPLHGRSCTANTLKTE